MVIRYVVKIYIRAAHATKTDCPHDRGVCQWGGGNMAVLPDILWGFATVSSAGLVLQKTIVLNF